ncbi:MAG TPA: hypothetical protein VMT20_19515 [Terriglobia bacterium]|nr:hypothetical protein [Terriglobia bacterium]
MDSLTTHVKQESERGLMLRILVEWGLEWMPHHELRMQLSSRLGYRIPDSELKFQINYLAQGGYAETKQLRAGRADIELLAVRATTKAADLIEGRLAPDPGIGV